MPLYELVLIATKKVPKSFFDSTRKTFIAANDKPGLANFERLWTTSQKEVPAFLSIYHEEFKVLR